MTHETFGASIGQVQTKFKDIIKFRMLSHLFLPILIMGAFVYWFINDAIAGDLDSETIVRGTLIFIPFITWLILGLFLTKKYDAVIYEKGFVLTEKRTKKVHEIPYAHVEKICNRTIRRLRQDFGLNRTYRLVSVNLKEKGKKSFFSFMKIHADFSLTAGNIAQVEKFGNSLVKAFDKYNDSI